MAEHWTVVKLLRWTADYFKGKAIDTGRLDAELLLADTLGLDRVGLYVHFDRPLNASELADFRAKVQRRAKHEPVQYILGETEFWSLPLQVGPDVLIPRSDTEVLVEEALQRLGECGCMLDVGTGSGAIAIAVAYERRTAVITAVDCSRRALAVASANAERHGLAGRITFSEGDLAELPPGPYDLVVSNPPYVAETEWAGLMPEVRDYEPRVALHGGTDGLDAYRQLARQATDILKPGGWLLVEVGAGQAAAVEQLFAQAGLAELVTRKDYAGIARVVCARAGQHAG